MRKTHTYILIEAIVSMEARKQNDGKKKNKEIISFRKLLLCTLSSFRASIGNPLHLSSNLGTKSFIFLTPRATKIIIRNIYCSLLLFWLRGLPFRWFWYLLAFERICGPLHLFLHFVSLWVYVIVPPLVPRFVVLSSTG